MSWIEGLEGQADQDEDIENPAPQFPPGQTDVNEDPVPVELTQANLGTAQDQLVIVMVGLPACGKTHISRRLSKYLEFFHSVPTRVFNVGNYRRKLVGAKMKADFFDADNDEAVNLRTQCRDAAMEDMIQYLTDDKSEDGGRVAFFDATNTTRDRRQWVVDKLRPIGVKVMFIESICNSSSLIDRNILEMKLGTPDYAGEDPAGAVEDFKRRRENYRKVYEEVASDPSELNLSYVKIVDLQRFTVHNIRSYLSGRIVQFLIHSHITPRTIFLTRPGQCTYRAAGRIGGDSRLTESGQVFAKRLGQFAESQICKDPRTGEECLARLFTSTLQRARETAAFIPHPKISHHEGQYLQMRPKELPNLDDIYAGFLDGMTSGEIARTYPEEYRRRKQRPMIYRYPRGESYMDLVHRLEPMAHEFERHQEPLLVIVPEAPLQVIYCYLTGRPREEAPAIELPKHSVIRLRLHAVGCDEDIFDLSGA